MGKAKRSARSADKNGRNSSAKGSSWNEVATLKFDGERFRDHGLDLDVCAELVQFRRMVVETAKALWKAANRDRKKLPPQFEETLRLRFFRLGEGSTEVPVEVPAAPPDGAFVDTGSRAEPAIELAWKILDAVARDEALPADVPRELVPEYSRWGSTLRAEETVGVRPRGKRTFARITALSRERLARYRDAPHDDVVEVQGTVLELNVRQRRCEVWREMPGVTMPLFVAPSDDAASAPHGAEVQGKVVVTFDEQHEEQLIAALRDHRLRKVFVRGPGKRSPEGAPISIERIETLELVSPQETRFDDTAPMIEDVLAEISARVPMEEWEKVPSDGSEHLDRYLYEPPGK